MYALPSPSTALGSRPRDAHFMTHESIDMLLHSASLGVWLYADTASWKSLSGLAPFGMTLWILPHCDLSSARKSFCGCAALISMPRAACAICPITLPP